MKATGSAGTGVVCFLKRREPKLDKYEQVFTHAGVNCVFVSPLKFHFPDSGNSAARTIVFRACTGRFDALHMHTIALASLRDCLLRGSDSYSGIVVTSARAVHAIQRCIEHFQLTPVRTAVCSLPTMALLIVSILVIVSWYRAVTYFDRWWCALLLYRAT
jgi:hypothetical protein